MVLPKRQPVPDRVLPEHLRVGVLAEVAQQMPFLLVRIATEPHQTRDQWRVGNVVDPSEHNATAETIDLWVERQGKKALLQLTPTRYRFIVIRHRRVLLRRD